MSTRMPIALLIVCLLLGACSGVEDHAAHADEAVRGPNGGRLLRDGPFAIELAIFESGVPPEYHAWPTLDGKAIPLEQVQLTVELRRLGDAIDRFRFTPHGDYLRGDGIVREPHSFVVDVRAAHAGDTHVWTYDSFEGRTTIAPEIAASAGIVTETAGPATLVETLPLHGRIVPAATHRREVGARFPGLIRKVHKSAGDVVRKGEALAVIESNESLQTYTLTAPIAGIVAQRDANEGEQSADRGLFTIVDSTVVWAELGVFPRDRARVQPGARVALASGDGTVVAHGRIERIDVQVGANQMVTARTTLDNAAGALLPGSFVKAEVTVGEHSVPLAVKTSALQSFRDFTVVFERIDATYEVRMLELGRQHGAWAEVLGGLEPGAQYVTQNSYLLKADVEKSGASHDH